MRSSRWSAELAARARGLRNVGEFRTHALEVCRRLVAFDRAVFTGFGPHEPAAVVDVDQEGLESIAQCERNHRRYTGDIRPVLEAGLRHGGCIDWQIYSSRDRRELPIFCEIVRPQRVVWTLILIPRWRSDILGMVRLERGRGRAFATSDLERALSLLPTVELGLAAFRSVAPGLAGTPLPRLSPREAEVAHHVGRGLTTGQIALVLGTSPLTVRNQLSRIFDKAKVASRTELATWLARVGAIQENGRPETG